MSKTPSLPRAVYVLRERTPLIPGRDMGTKAQEREDMEIAGGKAPWVKWIFRRDLKVEKRKLFSSRVRSQGINALVCGPTM